MLQAYRDQLKLVVRTRFDKRLSRRMDESDVVNEVMLLGCQQLPGWVRDGKSVYACLHRLVQNHLSLINRDHVTAQKRSVAHEAPAGPLSQDSVFHLCKRLGSRQESPSRVVMREEAIERIRAALDELPVLDREVVVLRTLEGTPVKEVAAMLGISEGSVKMRLLRTLKRLRAAMISLE